MSLADRLREAARTVRERAQAADIAEPSSRERLTYGTERDIADGMDLASERIADDLRERADRIEAGETDA